MKNAKKKAQTGKFGLGFFALHLTSNIGGQVRKI
jgi:hypothetical protein